MGKIDFGRLARDAADSARKLLDPRDIFNALPAKSTDLDYLRGPQDQVLEQWHRRRDSRDLVIKMNTGGGKTLVGLLIARSQLNEGLGPVAYLVPDHYLASQVCAEAERLGIETTSDPPGIRLRQWTRGPRRRLPASVQWNVNLRRYRQRRAPASGAGWIGHHR